MRGCDRPGNRHAEGRTRERGWRALGGLAAVLVGLTAACADSPTAPLSAPSGASLALATTSFSESFST